MYRRAGSLSVLSGALSGPYTGGRKVLDAALLDASVRERLDRATAGRGSPTPIAYERPAAMGSRLATWGTIVATMVLLALFTAGFGNLDSTWATQPRFALALYLVLGLLFAVSLLPLLRRRLLFGGGPRGALRPGRYLFPLDAVDVALPDADGRQTVVVRPLGDARDARIEGEGRQTELVIAFDGGERIRFPLRGDPSGEIALRRLEHAQRLIEELTYSKSLEQSFSNDVFFDIRVDGSWDRFAPGARPAAVRAPTVSSLVLGRLAPVVVGLLALSVGGGAYLARRELGDIALFNRAQQLGTVEALDRYLARGGRRDVAANDLRQRILDAEARAKREAEPAPKPKVPDPAAVRQRCVESLDGKASASHPKSAAYLAQMVKSDGESVLAVELRTTTEGGDTKDLNLPAAGQTVVAVLGEALGVSCGHALTVHEGEARPGVLIRTRVKLSAAKWRFGDEAPIDVRKAVYTFEVSFQDREGNPLEGFTLVLDPPAAAPLRLRDKSLFHMGLDMSLEERVNQAQTARAYDRLYDELWSLLFAGDPYVRWGAIDVAP